MNSHVSGGPRWNPLFRSGGTMNLTKTFERNQNCSFGQACLHGRRITVMELYSQVHGRPKDWPELLIWWPKVYNSQGVCAAPECMELYGERVHVLLSTGEFFDVPLDFEVFLFRN